MWVKFCFQILSTQYHGELTSLSLLGLSAAFNRSGHGLLLLTEWFGIDSVVLQSVRSYLPGRSYMVNVNGVLSTPQSLMCGVLQGSVLGTLLLSV